MRASVMAWAKVIHEWNLCLEDEKRQRIIVPIPEVVLVAELGCLTTRDVAWDLIRMRDDLDLAYPEGQLKCHVCDARGRENFQWFEISNRVGVTPVLLRHCPTCVAALHEGSGAPDDE